MPLVARASTTVRRDNFLVILMVAGTMAWFGYDGFFGYAKGNDHLVDYMRNTAIPNGTINSEFREPIEKWKGWNDETPAARQAMDDIVNSSKNRNKLEGWKSPNDILVQRAIVGCLALATLGAIGWFIQCQRRRVIADDATVSPAPGVIIPWERIKQVDNTRWQKGIVEITYTDSNGAARTTKFDDYKVDREPLLAILDLLAEKAVNAEFIPKVEAADSPPKNVSVTPDPPAQP